MIQIEKEISIHSATEINSIKCDMCIIKPLEERSFFLPKKTFPWVKMWDYREKSLLRNMH